MSRGQTLRALVNERLAAAAEDIFVLFERTIAEYEEELRRYKEENQKKQTLLDQVLSPRIELVRGNVQIPSTSPGPGLDQEITETPRIKEEPEEQQLPVSVPESSAECVKTEESSLLQQRQTEHREETQGEDISSEPHFHSETEGHTEYLSDADNDDDLEPFSWAAVPWFIQMETGVGGDHYNQVQIRDRSTELSPQNEQESTLHNDNMSGAEWRKHQFLVCNNRFTTQQILYGQMRVDTGENPFSCSFCKKTFVRKCSLDEHLRTHTGERPYCCPFCKKRFTQRGNLKRHSRIHTGEKPYSCTVCDKAFSDKYYLKIHMFLHRGQSSAES